MTACFDRLAHAGCGQSSDSPAAEAAVHHVTVFVTAVVGFATHHVDFMLDNFAHDFWSCHGLIAIIEHKVWDEHSISVHISDRTGGKVTAAPCNIHDHELAIRALRQAERR